MEDKLKLKGDVFITVKDKDGNVKEERHEKNLVVTTGLNFICSRMKDTTAGAMSHMGLGSGTTAAAGDTDLGSLLGSREALDSTTVSSNTITYVASFEAGDATGLSRNAVSLMPLALALCYVVLCFQQSTKRRQTLCL